MPSTDSPDSRLDPPPGSSAYYALRRCAPRHRAALTLLLSFHVQVRKIIDTVSDPAVAQAKLAWWNGQIDALANHAAEHPTLRALGPFLQTHGLPPNALRGVIDSVQIDLQQNRWMDRAALLHYCARGNGQSLRNGAVILGLTSPEALSAAETLGVGLRLTGSIRNLGRDAAQGRIYLPLDALQRHAVTAAQLQQRNMDARVLALLQEQTALTRQTLESALAGLALHPAVQTAPMLALGTMSLALLREIEQSDYAVLHQRISLTPLRKLWISRTCTRRRG